MRVAIASAKGGVAKTTTAMFLASAAVLRGEEAVVLDADPQSTASLWRDMSSQSEVVPFEVQAANVVTLSRRSADTKVWEFVDCPPIGRALSVAVEESDFVIVPSSDSATDLQQAWATLGAVHDTPAAVLLTRVEPRTLSFSAAMSALEEAGTPRFEAVVHKRQTIKRSFGRKINDLYEYGQVFTELKEVLR